MSKTSAKGKCLFSRVSKTDSQEPTQIYKEGGMSAKIPYFLPFFIDPVHNNGLDKVKGWSNLQVSAFDQMGMFSAVLPSQDRSEQGNLPGISIDSNSETCL